MKKRILSLALALCLALSLLPGTALAAGEHPFTDVPDTHWASDAVAYVYQHDLMDGTGEATFSPGSPLTRAMFVTILGRLAGAPENAAGDTGFTDVPAGQWYTPYVAWAAQTGVADGTGNGTFSPSSPVTREQMATMITRYVDTADRTLPESDTPAAPFSDAAAVAPWARAGVERMRQTGLLAGYEDGTFRPQRTANRAEAATLFLRLHTALEEGSQAPGIPAQVQAEYQTFQTHTEAIDAIQTTFLNQDDTVDREDVPALLDQVTAYAQQAQAAGDVAQYTREDNTVAITFASGVEYLYQPPVEGALSGGSQIAALTPKGSLANRFGVWVREVEAWLDVAFSDGDHTYHDTEACAQLLQDGLGGGSVAHLDGSAVTVDQVKALGDYDYILWEGHGAYSETLHSCLVTDESCSMWNYFQHREDLQAKRLVTTSGLGTPYYCVTPAFVQAYVGDLEGAVVFLGACYSGKDDTLANAFLDKGAAAVLGYTDEVYIPYEMLTRSFFFEAFSQGDVTVSQAVDYAKTLVGPELMEGLPGDLTLFPAGSDVTLLPQEADTAWKAAYRDYIQEDLQDTANNSGTGPLMEQAQYYLFDANGDATPELWIDYMFTYAGQRLCTYAGGQVVVQPITAGALSYLPGENCLLASGGRMDVYYDVLYRIENGRFLQTARGDYTTNFEASNASGDLVFDYTWNGSPVSSATYRNNLATLFDQTRGEALWETQGLSYQEILVQLAQ